MSGDRTTIALRIEPELHARAKIAARAAGSGSLTEFMIEAIAARVDQVAAMPEFTEAVGRLRAEAQAMVAELDAMLPGES